MGKQWTIINADGSVCYPYGKKISHVIYKNKLKMVENVESKALKPSEENMGVHIMTSGKRRIS